MDKLNLEACPFCGGAAEYEEDWDANYSNRVACTACPATVSVIKGDFSRWNRGASTVSDGELPPLTEGQRENAEFTEWWNREQACPEHSLITENAAHAAWQERARRQRAAIAADRARQGEPVISDDKLESELELLVSIITQGGISEKVARDEIRKWAGRRAATKAAAPAGAIVRPLDDQKMAEYLRGQPWISTYIETLESELRKAKAAPAGEQDAREQGEKAALEDVIDFALELGQNEDAFSALGFLQAWNWEGDSYLRAAWPEFVAFEAASRCRAQGGMDNAEDRRAAPEKAQSGEPEARAVVPVPVEAYLWLMGLGLDGFTEDRDGAFWWRGAFNERAGLDMMAIWKESKARPAAKKEGGGNA